MSRRVYAAVIKTVGQPPVYELIDLPAPTTNQVQVQVLASGIHRVVRSISSGHHYSKSKTLSVIPGIDGVGTLSNGKKVYFVIMTPPNGSMSEHMNIDSENTIALPDSANPTMFAAIMNAGMGSWVALRERAHIQPGETVLILGVTGSSGQMAALSAHFLGAKRIIGVGRNKAVLDQLLVDGKINTSIVLDDDEARFQQAIANDAASADIVLDYLWGRPTEVAMTAILSSRTDSTQRLRWIEIGQTAGATIQLPAAYLRGKNIEISGSGLGSISTKEILQSLEHMVPLVMEGKLTTSVMTIPLKDIEKKWGETADAKERVVVVM